jgi:hypothetical protein
VKRYVVVILLLCVSVVLHVRDLVEPTSAQSLEPEALRDSYRLKSFHFGEDVQFFCGLIDAWSANKLNLNGRRAFSYNCWKDNSSKTSCLHINSPALGNSQTGLVPNAKLTDLYSRLHRSLINCLGGTHTRKYSNTANGFSLSFCQNSRCATQSINLVVGEPDMFELKLILD